MYVRCEQVAGKTNDSAGDGTTTASVLARELIKYGLQSVTAGRNPVALKRGMDKACAALVKILDERAVPVSGPSDITAVAAISAGNDLEVCVCVSERVPPHYGGGMCAPPPALSDNSAQEAGGGD